MRLIPERLRRLLSPRKASPKNPTTLSVTVQYPEGQKEERRRAACLVSDSDALMQAPRASGREPGFAELYAQAMELIELKLASPHGSTLGVDLDARPDEIIYRIHLWLDGRKGFVGDEIAFRLWGPTCSIVARGMYVLGPYMNQPLRGDTHLVFEVLDRSSGRRLVCVLKDEDLKSLAVALIARQRLASTAIEFDWPRVSASASPPSPAQYIGLG